MFNPLVGSIIMALAEMACLGSLLGWQFTIAMTAKSAAEDRMFPALFKKVNSMGAPLTGMLVMGVVQTLLALSTMSPTLSEQFYALVNLAVVTNVVPYIMALSALIVMMQKAGTPQSTYRLNVAVTVLALLYSIYAIYASGASAVLGGMLVMGIGYTIYGFLSPRFELTPGRKVPVAAGAVALALLCGMGAAPGSAATLDRIRETGVVRLGYLDGVRPFSYRDEAGKPAGYAVKLCERVAADLGRELSLPALRAEFVPVERDVRFDAVAKGSIDLLCAAGAPSLRLREQVSFSIPIFPGGIGALVRKDSPAGLRAILSGEPQPFSPRWRASLGQVLQRRTFTVVGKSPTETWLAGRMTDFDHVATIAPVDSLDLGVERVASRNADVMYGERDLLLGAAKRSASANELTVLERKYTFEPIAFALARGDEDFRLFVDRALSRFYGSADLRGLYEPAFGKPDAETERFFRNSTLPE